MTNSVTTHLVLAHPLDGELMNTVFLSNSQGFTTPAAEDDELENILLELGQAEFGTFEVCKDGLGVNITKNSVKEYFNGPTMSIRVSEQAFKSDSSEEIADNYIEIVREIIEDTSPRYGFGAFLVEEHLAVERPPYKQDIETGDIDELFWLNYFSSDVADKLGHEFLLDTPAWLVEKLNDGGVFLVTMPNPVGPGDEYDMHVEAADHLGFNAH